MRYIEVDMEREKLLQKIEGLREMEARSCSMDPALMTPEYMFRLLGGTVPLEEIREAMKLL